MGAAGDDIEIFSGGSVLLRSPRRLLERRVIKGASSSDDDDATDVSDEHDDDEFDDDDGAKKPSANERSDDVIGAVGYYCEGGVVVRGWLHHSLWCMHMLGARGALQPPPPSRCPPRTKVSSPIIGFKEH